MKRIGMLLSVGMWCTTTFGQSLELELKVKSDPRSNGGKFGNAISMDGSRAVVGSYFDGRDENGNNFKAFAGSAYILERDAEGNWSEEHKFVAQDRSTSDRFGEAVALWGDYALVGSFSNSTDSLSQDTIASSGAAYLFERDSLTGAWNQRHKLVAFDRDTAYDFYGYSVCISEDYAFVGATQQDYDANGNNFISGAGAVYVYKRSGSNWSFQTKLTANVRNGGAAFGTSLAYAKGTLFVGAPSEKLDETEANSLNGAGAVYAFSWDGNTNKWVQQQKIVPADRAGFDAFGWSLASHGNWMAVGAYREDDESNGPDAWNDAGAVYLFQRDTGSGTWVEQQKIIPAVRYAKSEFGSKLAMDDKDLLIGVPIEYMSDTETDSLYRGGAAFHFSRDTSGTWMLERKLSASDRAKGDQFGNGVGISEGYALVGAPEEDEDAQGLNYLGNDGSVYSYGPCRETRDSIQVASCDTVYTSPGGQVLTSSGTYHDTLVNHWGCDSILVVDLSFVVPTEHTFQDTVCLSYTSPSGKIWDSTGIYQDTLVNAAGCDSILTVDLLVIKPNTTVVQNQIELSAADSTLSYQWLDCSNAYAELLNDTLHTFVAQSNGLYAVEVEEMGCKDTSACVQVVSVGTVNTERWGINVYPNPTAGTFVVDFGTRQEAVDLNVYDMRGRLVWSRRAQGGTAVLCETGLQAGVYLMTVSVDRKVMNVKVRID